MKKSALLASMIAASATGVCTTSTATTTTTATLASSAKPPPPVHQGIGWSQEREESAREKFAPRFDGLRFIETLVTAHR